MLNIYEKRVAIISGASNGIGQELAINFAKRGAQLVLLDIDDSSITQAKIEEFTKNVISIKCNVGVKEDWENARKIVEDTFGRADILVNNAGIYPFKEFDELDIELFRKVINVNLESAFLGAKAFVPLMEQNQSGRIINIASNSIGTNLTGLSHYMASKMGVIGFSRGLANDLGPKGITVNVVAPAITRTAGTSNLPEDVLESVWSKQAIKRFGEPQDIVGPILFLASEDAGFITGQTIVVDGGMMKL